MNSKPFPDGPGIGSLLAGIPRELPRELIEILVDRPGIRIERIVSRGQASPDGFWYDQERPEWVALFRGRARLRFEDGEEMEMGPGDHLLIEAHRRHRVEWTDPDVDTIWLAVHVPASGS